MEDILQKLPAISLKKSEWNRKLSRIFATELQYTLTMRRIFPVKEQLLLFP